MIIIIIIVIIYFNYIGKYLLSIKYVLKIKNNQPTNQ